MLTSYASHALGSVNAQTGLTTTAINWTITPSTRYGDGTRVIPGMTESSLTVPLIFAGRIVPGSVEPARSARHFLDDLSLITNKPVRGQ